VTPANSYPANSDHALTSKTITVDQWYNTRFHLTDQEVTQISDNDMWRMPQLDEAVKALANQVDGAVLALYKDVYNNTGTAGTTPFASSAQFATDALKGAAKKLRDGLTPDSERYVVLDSAAEAAVLSLAEFNDLARSGRDEGIIEGEMGRRFGVDWYVNQNVPTHTHGTATAGTALQLNAEVAAGATSLVLKDSGGSLTGTVVEGDLLEIGGYQYVSNATYTAASNLITVSSFSPAAGTTHAANTAVTHKADSVSNMMFHRDAFALVSKFPEDASGIGRIVPVYDPITGLTFRLEIARQYYETTWYLDVLYGVQTIRPEFACRILG
jgi:hypothetical protein